jgi:hypothetical protein
MDLGAEVSTPPGCNEAGTGHSLTVRISLPWWYQDLAPKPTISDSCGASFLYKH